MTLRHHVHVQLLSLGSGELESGGGGSGHYVLDAAADARIHYRRVFLWIIINNNALQYISSTSTLCLTTSCWRSSLISDMHAKNNKTRTRGCNNHKIHSYLDSKYVQQVGKWFNTMIDKYHDYSVIDTTLCTIFPPSSRSTTLQYYLA